MAGNWKPKLMCRGRLGKSSIPRMPQSRAEWPRTTCMWQLQFLAINCKTRTYHANVIEILHFNNNFAGSLALPAIKREKMNIRSDERIWCTSFCVRFYGNFLRVFATKMLFMRILFLWKHASWMSDFGKRPLLPSIHPRMAEKHSSLCSRLIGPVVGSCVLSYLKQYWWRSIGWQVLSH